jgi:hypothetical protein
LEKTRKTLTALTTLILRTAYIMFMTEGEVSGRPANSRVEGGRYLTHGVINVLFIWRVKNVHNYGTILYRLCMGRGGRDLQKFFRSFALKDGERERILEIIWPEPSTPSTRSLGGKERRKPV